MDIVLLELLDRWNRQVVGELLVRRDTVELRVGDHVRGIADRDYLRDWLSHPQGVYAYDDMAWLAAGNGVALCVDDEVPALVLADHVLADIRTHV